MPCPKIKSGARFDPDMYMDVDEVAYPEGHTLWDKVTVPGASKLTLGDFIELFKREHKLVLQERLLVLSYPLACWLAHLLICLLVRLRTHARAR